MSKPDKSIRIRKVKGGFIITRTVSEEDSWEENDEIATSEDDLVKIINDWLE